MSSKEPFRFPEELKRRILFTLFILAIFRIGVSVPTPGVDGSAVFDFVKSQGSGLFGLFNTFGGGALARFSIFALTIMPYISASIIFQLVQSAFPYFESLKKEGESGRKKINQYTRYLTLFIAAIQAYFIATSLESANQQGTGLPLVLVHSFGFISFRLMTVITLTAGTCFLMWLGEQITERGIGNGSSLIIFAGIAASVPSGAFTLYKMVSSGEMNPLIALFFILGMVATIAAIIFMETAQRRIPIHYSQRTVGNKISSQQQSHLPLKINFANVIPPIFASSLLVSPAMLAQYVQVPWIKAMSESFNPNGDIYNILFTLLVIFFCFFYTEIAFNPTEVSDNLKKYGGFIPGIRAGKSTADYLKKVLDRLTITGAIYLCLVCLMPVVVSRFVNLPFLFGGTSLLILVGVALDTAQQIQSHLITAKYDGIMSGVKIKSRRVQY